MAKKKQTRRAISLAAPDYVVLKKLVELGELGDNPTQVVTNFIQKAAKHYGIEIPSRADAVATLLGKPQEHKTEEVESIASQHFTF